jgi:hypothetical protein
MPGSVSGLGSLAGMRSAMGPQSAALGVSRGEEANLVQEAAERSLPVSKDGNRSIAEG